MWGRDRWKQNIENFHCIRSCGLSRSAAGPEIMSSTLSPALAEKIMEHINSQQHNMLLDLSRRHLKMDTTSSVITAITSKVSFVLCFVICVCLCFCNSCKFVCSSMVRISACVAHIVVQPQGRLSILYTRFYDVSSLPEPNASSWELQASPLPFRTQFHLYLKRAPPSSCL